MKWLSLLIMLSACSPAAGVMLTEHVGYKSDLNEVHPFVSVSHHIGESTSITSSAYWNSHEKISITAGVRQELGDRFYVSVFGATGYEEKPRPMGYVGYRLTENIDLFGVPSGRGRYVIGTAIYWSKK